MADDKQQEPSMEEILASIRRIITDDDEEGQEEVVTETKAPPPEPEKPVAAPEEPAESVAAEDDDEDILELADPVETGKKSAAEDEIAFADPEPEPEPIPEPEPEAVPEPVMTKAAPAPAPKKPKKAVRASVVERYEALLSDEPAAVAAGAFQALRQPQSALLPEGPQFKGQGKTVDDLARELMYPVLKNWLDKHLPSIVERLVREEIRRLTEEDRITDVGDEE